MRKKSLFFILPAFTVLLTAFYILQINSLTALAYHSAKTERTIEKLTRETTMLQIETHGAISPNDLQALAKAMHFEKAGSISYVTSAQGPVAQNFR
jgi:hypothetical protein